MLVLLDSKRLEASALNFNICWKPKNQKPKNTKQNKTQDHVTYVTLENALLRLRIFHIQFK